MKPDDLWPWVWFAAVVIILLGCAIGIAVSSIRNGWTEWPPKRDKERPS